MEGMVATAGLMGRSSTLQWGFRTLEVISVETVVGKGDLHVRAPLGQRRRMLNERRDATVDGSAMEIFWMGDHTNAALLMSVSLSFSSRGNDKV